MTRRDFLAGLLKVSAATIIAASLPAPLQETEETLDLPTTPEWERLTTAQVDKILKEVYGGRIAELLNEPNPLWVLLA